MEDERKWEDLAYDCLVTIFCHLRLKDLTLALPFVCKSWHKASLDSRPWKKINFWELGPFFLFGSDFERRFKQEYGISNFSFSSFMKLCIGRSGRSVVELVIPDFGDVSILPILIPASIGCPRLKVISIPMFCLQDHKQIPELISKWKELEILKIAGNTLPNSFLEILEQISINCPNFIGLHLYALFSGTMKMTGIVRCIPRLKILVIRESTIYKEDLMIIIEGCKELEVLKVSCCQGFDLDEEILMKTAMIKKFVCEGTAKY